MFVIFSTIKSPLGCRPFSTIVTRVRTFLPNSGGCQIGGSGSSKKGKLVGVSSFLDSGREDTMKGWSLGTLGSHNTMGFPSVNDILGRGWFFGDRGPCK